MTDATDEQLGRGQAPPAPVLLFRALRAPNVPNLGPLFVARGLAVSDDPGGFRPSAGVSVARGGGAYFALEEAYTLALAATRRYRRGVVTATLAASDFAALCTSGGILPDPLLPGVGVRVQPEAFGAFNGATNPGRGRRTYAPTGATLPSGAVVP